jgi:hypothetical protein
MKWMKVIHTSKSMMSQEFQHCVESQMIQVMIVKMQTIQRTSLLPSEQAVIILEIDLGTHTHVVE